MNLTDKEREVLGYLCEGMPSKQIAGLVGLKPDNTRQLIWKLCRRFNCANSAALTAYATKHELTNKS